MFESRQFGTADANGAAQSVLPDQMVVGAFLANIPDHVYFKDRDSRFLSVSVSLAESFGRSVSEIIGKTDFDFFDDARARSYRDAELRILATGEALIDREVQHTWPDGRVTWSLNIAMPMHDSRGQIVGIFGTNKDITRRKETEAQLAQLQRRLNEASHAAGMAEIATNVLHNVGNVLNSVNVSASLLASRAHSPKATGVKRLVDLLEGQGNNLSAFLAAGNKAAQVLDYLKETLGEMETEQIEAQQELVSLQNNIDHIKEIVAMQQTYAKSSALVETVAVAELVEDSLRLNEGAFGRHGVSVNRMLEDVPPIATQRHKVMQILVNLLRNAKYACDEPGVESKVVTVRVEKRELGVRISVHDTGIGIAAETMGQLFAHGFTTRALGHGFGLHSAALAARELGGTLTAHSEGLGLGATFTLELPFETKGPNHNA